MSNQLRWVRHVVRMKESRLPKQIFFCELSQGNRTRGRPTLRYKDTLKASLKSTNIDTSTWQAQAMDRPAWRAAIHSGVKAFEADTNLKIDNKRAARKQRDAQPPDNSAVTCSVCGRLCKSQFGLRAHMRVH